MSTAVLPFNAGPETKPALARQLANFIVEVVRRGTGEQIEAVSYLVRLDGNPPRFANVNPSEQLNEPEMISQLLDQSAMDRVVDGLLTAKGERDFELTLREFESGAEEPKRTQQFDLREAGIFTGIWDAAQFVSSVLGKPLPPPAGEDEPFGTTSPQAFLDFLEGYDALQYVDRAQGQVATEFKPEVAMDRLLAAIESDPEWEAPFASLAQLCRLCTSSRIGTAEAIHERLRRLTELVPDDARAYFALGELFEALNQAGQAADAFEKAHSLDPEEPAILTRLGMAQMNMGMPANAERNFRRALEMEGPEAPSADFLASVLAQSGRAHEVPAMWRSVLERNPQSPKAKAMLASALVSSGQEAEGLQEFEQGLTTLEDNAFIKRMYAPVLAAKGDFDRAMDLFEDCLDANPTDVGLLLEYARTLQAAGREFEVPKVLRDVLGTNPDPNTRAQVLAWLIELEQPKRVEAVASAQQRLEAEDYEGAIRELRPLRNWLADYWKMWALLSAAHNRLNQPVEAEEAGRRLIELFPACEPGYGELASALGAQGKHDEAYDLMRYAAANIPNSLPVALNLALAAKRAGHEEEARALGRQIREVVGNNQDLAPILEEIEREIRG